MPDLPRFTYHPNPVETGSIVESDQTCLACNQKRGWIYTGPVYCETDLDDALCPWCISDGTAHSRFQAEFVDPKAVGDYGNWESVPLSVIEEVCFRTPSFNGWQQERWFTHCKDAAIFLGPGGKPELDNLDRELTVAIASESGFTGQDLIDYLGLLDKDDGPTAFIFRCRHCNVWGGYSDNH